jgi:hypothetical protein
MECIEMKNRERFGDHVTTSVRNLLRMPPCPNEILKCYFHGCFVQDDNRIHIVLAEGFCVDMDGAIKLAGVLNDGPYLREIVTWSGVKLDTIYRIMKFEGGWEVFVPKSVDI